VTAERAAFERDDPEFRRISVVMAVGGFAVYAVVFGPQGALGAIGADLGLDASAAALVVSAAAIGVAAGVLPWSMVADRLGRARAIRISVTLAAVAAVLAPFAPDLGTLLVLRVLAGLAVAALPSVGAAYLVEQLHPRHATVAVGTFIAGNTIGGIVGRVVAGPVGELIGWRWALAVLAALIVLAAIVVVRLPRDRVAAVPMTPRGTAVEVLWHLRSARMLAVYAQGFLVMGAFAAVYNVLGFRLVHEPFHVPAVAVSFVFLAYLGGSASSRVATGLAARVGRLRVMLVGVAVLEVGLALMLAEQLPVVLVGLVVFTVGCFGVHPIASALSGQLPTRGRAQSTALYQLGWLAGTAVLGWLGGAVAVAAGWTGLTILAAGLGATAGLVAVLGLRGMPRLAD